jgi:hypothetical protein
VGAREVRRTSGSGAGAIASGEGKGRRARTVGSRAHEVHREVREVRVLRLRTGRHRELRVGPCAVRTDGPGREAHAKQGKVVLSGE